MRTPGLITRARAAGRSPLHDERTAAWLGVILGVAVVVCFVTGVLSHLIQHPPSWFDWPSRPAGLYRITQGVHVTTGFALVPLVLAKLWVVYPKLFRWPPFESFAHAVERVMLVPLIGGVLFEIATGVPNVAHWYPWPFTFRRAHYAIAWITLGALVIHLVAKWSITLRGLQREQHASVTPDVSATAISGAVGRRAFVGTVLSGAGLLALLTVGQTAAPLRKLALLAPRRPDSGPQGFPVNTSAAQAGVVEASPVDYRLIVDGVVKRTLSLGLDDLRATGLHEATLPIACVEGWSASRRWRGVRVRDLLAMAGARPDAEVTVHSMQGGTSPSRTSELNASHAHDRDTLLALEVEGQPLSLDHGYPIRLVGPNRPGTMQTKWVKRLHVH